MAKTKSKRIQSLIKAFEALSQEQDIKASSLKLNFYPFSNESGVSKVLKKLRSLLPFSTNKKIRVAILTGQSSICSILPELEKHCDVVLFVDINPHTMQHIQFLLKGLQNQETVKAFKQYYEPQHEVLKALDFEASDVTPDIDMREETLDEDFFLSSKERYNSCKEAASNLKFGFSKINLFDQKQFESLTSLLKKRKAKISLFNATNLYEWDAPTALAKLDSYTSWEPKGNVENIIKNLESKPLILHSVRKNVDESCDLRAKLSLDTEEFKTKNLKGVQRKLYYLHGEKALTQYPDLFKDKSTLKTKKLKV